jgi:glycosyltransferase involved in cell wall biosynthesis
MKIVYVIDSLSSKGGAERILSDKMNYMAATYGYEVHVITCYQDPATMPNAYYLSGQVHQSDLCIPYYSQYRYRYPKRLFVKTSIYRRLVRELTAEVQRIDPDVLVGLGYFQADVVCGIPCRAAKVVESHEARIFTMSDKGLSRSWLSRAYMRFYKRRYFRAVERKADVVVTLTTGDAKEWARARRVEVIPNFTVMPVGHHSDGLAQRVIAVGRLEWQKGFDRLIEAWSIVSPGHPGWQLDIFGSGTLEEPLKAQIARCGLQSVSLHPFTPHIAQEYSRSGFFALSSRFEGFGLVLLEAMQAGLPCVTFDCPFGPSDVVVDGSCGFVVPDGDVAQFAEKIARLMDDASLRQSFSEAAIGRAKDFNVDTVMSQWRKLFEQLAMSS